VPGFTHKRKDRQCPTALWISWFSDFPEINSLGEIIPALEELVETGTVRIIDLLFVIKDADGAVGVLEVDALGDAIMSLFEPIAKTNNELLSRSDGEHFGTLLEPDSSAALLLFENAWASRFVEAVAKAHGEVILNERIPRMVIEEVVAETTEP
jgi:hypothetical protein